MNRRETEFRRYLRGLLGDVGVWTVSVEHRSGGTPGCGDLLVQVGEFLMPVELKVGEWRKATNKLHSSTIRPAQIRFLDEAFEAGIAARLVIGVKRDRAWQVWMLRNVKRERLIHWRSGFEESELVRILRGYELLIPVPQW